VSDERLSDSDLRTKVEQAELDILHLSSIVLAGSDHDFHRSLIVLARGRGACSLPSFTPLPAPSRSQR
jgi:hypothetical protein